MSSSVSHPVVGFQEGLDWRPLTFEKALPSVSVCGLCGVVPRSTLVLPCWHVLCETCYLGAQDRGRVCPLDGRSYDRDGVGTVTLPTDQVLQLRVACWNQGCSYLGPVSSILTHFEKDCTFHTVSCKR